MFLAEFPRDIPRVPVGLPWDVPREPMLLLLKDVCVMTPVGSCKGWRCRLESWTYFILFYFSIPLITFALLFSLPPSRNSDPGSHSRLFSPPHTTVRALLFDREKISALSSLVDSRRIVPTHARRFQQLILFYFL